MLIQYMSDLHLEFLGKKFKNLFKVIGDVLCLAGDICACGVKEDLVNFIEFLEYICPKYQYVIHVAGNHEFYTAGSKHISKENTMEGLNNIFKSLMKKIPNYIYLNCSVANIKVNKKNYTFIGATLWSYINPPDHKMIENNMNDYQYIYTYKNGKPTKYTVADMQRLHKKHVNFITKAIKEAKNNTCILLTHHKPVADTPKECRDFLTQAYETDMTKHILSNVKVAIHGHTHKHYHRIINGTKYISNPLGYPSQRTKFVKDLTIKV